MNKFINLTVVKLTTHYNWYSKNEVFGNQIRKIRMKNTEFKEREGWAIVLNDAAKNRIDDTSAIAIEDYLRHPQFVNTFISMDEIAQIETVPQWVVIYKNENEHNVVPVFRLTVKTGRGRGINGINHDIYILPKTRMLH